MRIFVSSTTQDLKDYRRAVITAISRSGHTPVCMEHQAAKDITPLEESLRKVRDSNLYVGIFAWRYGFIPHGQDRSITELEYREAVRYGIPTFIFILDESIEWPRERRDDGAQLELLLQLRRELELTKWRRPFFNPDNLAVEVLSAIMRLQFEKAQEATIEGEEKFKEELAILREDRAERERKRRRKERERVPNPIPEKLIRHFQDRYTELSKLRQCLDNKNLRMVSICGRGGVGKTTLAAKLSIELKESFREEFSSAMDSVESIVYVPLDDVGYRTPDRIVELLSRTLDTEATDELKEFWNQGGASLHERLSKLFRGPLSQHRSLIVLDNLESVMDNDNRISQEFVALCQFIEAFLKYDHISLLIVTSRRALSLSPDAEIAAIGRRAQIALDEGLPESFAIALLRKLDCDSQRQLGIRNATDEVLGNIVRCCQYIPRTLETLVGTLLQRPTWTLDTLLANETLFTQIVDNPTRELYTSLSSDQERLVIQALAVYDKPVPSAAIRYILPALPIDEILDKFVCNFVATHDRGLLWLHPLDRQYAYSQIPEEGNDYSKPVLHKKAAQFYQKIPCPSRGSRASLDDIEPMLDAIEHLLAADQAEDAAALFLDNALHEDLHWWGYYLLLSDLCRRLLNRSISPKKKITLYILLGKVYRNLGDFEEAKSTYEKALPLINDTNDPESETGLFNALGDISYYLNDRDRALEYLRRAEELLVMNPNPTLQSENAGDMANVMWSEGQYEEAIRCYEKAISCSRNAGNSIYEGIWNGGLANVHGALFFNTGDPVQLETAVSHYLQAIAIAKEAKDRRHESHWSGNLGNFYRQIGNYEQAEAYLKKALTISEKIHYVRMISTQVQWLDAVFRERTMQYIQNLDFVAALQVSREFQQDADEIGSAELKDKAESLLGEITLNMIAFLFQEGRMGDAVADGREFLTSSVGKPDMCAALGSICLQWGRQTAQKNIFQLSVEAYTKAITVSPDNLRHSFYLERANAYALLGKIEEAIADYSEVTRRDPQNTSAALSRAEVLIWAGRYCEARFSLEVLHPQLRSTAEKAIGAWLMCHALNLENRDFSAYKKVLENETKENMELNYGVRDIETYLQRLDQTKFSYMQILNAWMIQSVIIKFGEKW